ncbi:hypothetical protein CVT26_004709 [Gymnopilus dilepis]|uniref:Uncharacterized protein n=1 Tax=Gymnopilus dilepis TaxID=231916 RepID=A0A409XZ67_9AGAR|nr:hypothetical protein CVT26_004709 [Gymnopilus dilepis]
MCWRLEEKRREKMHRQTSAVSRLAGPKLNDHSSTQIHPSYVRLGDHSTVLLKKHLHITVSPYLIIAPELVGGGSTYPSSTAAHLLPNLQVEQRLGVLGGDVGGEALAVDEERKGGLRSPPDLVFGQSLTTGGASSSGAAAADAVDGGVAGQTSLVVKQTICILWLSPIISAKHARKSILQ